MNQRDKFLTVSTFNRAQARSLFDMPHDTPVRAASKEKDGSALYEVWVAEGPPEGDGWRQD